MSSYYPVFLDVKNKLCVVIGGGEVAERKTKALLGQGAVVAVISQHFTEGLESLATQKAIRAIRRDYRSGDLQGALVAIAATDDSTANRKVASEGKRQKVLVNVVDDPEVSDFIVPSLVCRGDVTIAISTGGRSPALARKIRTELESIIGPEYNALAQLLSELRGGLKENGSKISGDAWQKALDLSVLLPLLRAGQTEEARKLLINSLNKSSEG